MARGSMQDGWLLSSQEIRTLGQREYHYNAYSNTILDRYMQPFWRYLVTYIPTSVTASPISLCGLLCNVIATCITISYGPTLTEPLPPSISILNAVSIFLYQTCDGLDGKQCHRTQDSEVEEYADHAVDSISVTLNAILLAAAMQLGDSPFLLGANFLLAMTAFFAAHWAAQRTDSLVFGVVDVTEAQFGMIAIHGVAAWGGKGFWELVVVEGLEVRAVVAVGSMIPLLFAIAENAMLALGVRETPLERHGIRIPRLALSLWPVGIYAIIVSGSMLCIARGLLTSLTLPTMLVIGLTLGRAGTGLIVQKILKEPGLRVDLAYFSPFGLYALYLLYGNDARLVHSAVWTLAALVTLEVLWFHMRVMLDLAKARDINIFSMKRVAGRAPQQSHGFYVSNGEFAAAQDQWKNFAASKTRKLATYGRADP